MAKWRVLVADTAAVAGQIRGVLAEICDAEIATTYEAALQAMDGGRFDLVVVGYHFDEVRPYRLIQEVQARRGAGPRVLVVRALPLLHVKTHEDEMRASYLALGADHYLVLRGEEEPGAAAIDKGALLSAAKALLRGVR